MNDEGLLSLKVDTRAILVASRIRTTMEQRGYGALDPGAPAHAQEFGIVVRRGPDRNTWVHPEFAEAIPESLGTKLSHDLRCRVTTVVRAGQVTAYEIAENGSSIEKLAMNGEEILEDSGCRTGERVRQGEALSALLVEAGLTETERTYQEVLGLPGRKMPLRFAPLPGRAGAGGGELEIDPLLECPSCASPMQLQQGKFGEFYGCVRFPACRGRLTAKQADVLRQSRGG